MKLNLKDPMVKLLDHPELHGDVVLIKKSLSWLLEGGGIQCELIKSADRVRTR